MKHSNDGYLPASLLLALLVNSFACVPARAAEAYPAPADLPSRPALPDPLVMMDGSRVTAPQQWTEKRRPELKALFEHYMYGHAPARPAGQKFAVVSKDAQYLGGKATKKEVVIALGADSAPKIHLLLLIPNQRQKPAPVFLGLGFCGMQSVIDDPRLPLATNWMPKHCAGCENNRATEASRGAEVKVWNAETILERGYALAVFYNGDVEPDLATANEGIRAYYRQLRATHPSVPDYDWGAIAAWAWGMQRAVDYLVTDPDLDARRIAAVGHSRNGKATLLASAFDERIALAIPLQAGCGGTAPSRADLGETVKQINSAFPHWFNGQFKAFNSEPDRLPFDQHCLVALMAPRPVLFPNAVEDTWANPAGQFRMLQAADPVYRLLKAGGLDATSMPSTNQLVKGKLGYFIRPGKHSMSAVDWNAFLDFADQNLK